VCSPVRESRAPRHARRLAATATLAAASLAGVTVGTATPASAAAAPDATPVVSFSANHTSVAPGTAVTFTVTEHTSSGKAVPAAHAVFYVHTKSGWEKWKTATLSASGTAAFVFHPNYTHYYRVDLSAVSASGTEYSAASTKDVTVTVSLGSQIVAAAAKEKGKPYRNDAAGPNAFDCSGLTEYVFHEFGIKLPHNAEAQRKYGTSVSAAHREPGDLVFVMSGSTASHVAIYAGGGKWWEAPHTGASVRLVTIWSSHVQYRHVS